jgi:hypothetical protein
MKGSFVNINLLRPIFILGNPRSGTSLFRIMLTCHPSIHIAPECGFIQWWFQKYKDWSISDSKNEGKVDEFIKDLSSSKKINSWRLNYKRIKNSIIENLPENYSELSACIYLEHAKDKTELLYWGDKNNYYIKHMDLLKTLFPDAYFLFIVRDGRDVACSYIELANSDIQSEFKPSLSHQIEDIANEWNSNNIAIEEFLSSVNEESKIIVRYEDLLSKTEAELKRITDKLQISFSGEMLKYHEINKDRQIEPVEMLEWKKKTLEKPDISNIGRYSSLLTKKQITRFNSIAGNLLTKYGYN